MVELLKIIGLALAFGSLSAFFLYGSWIAVSTKKPRIDVLVDKDDL